MNKVMAVLTAVVDPLKALFDALDSDFSDSMVGHAFGICSDVASRGLGLQSFEACMAWLWSVVVHRVPPWDLGNPRFLSSESSAHICS